MHSRVSLLTRWNPTFEGINSTPSEFNSYLDHSLHTHTLRKERMKRSIERMKRKALLLIEKNAELERKQDLLV